MIALLPLAIGIGFGFALERAGLGDARKLTGQFYLRDLTVFKVMFSAIVTAMLGLFWLSYVGWIDLAAIAIPETYLRPQIAGGVIFGAGFALAGLCPGTSCVAAASGRGDGLAVVAGLFTGVLAAGVALPRFVDFYDSDARGAWTLPALLHLPSGVVALGVVLAALAGFAAATHIERRRSLPASSHPGKVSRIGWSLAILALALGAAAAIVRAPARAHAPAAMTPVYKPPNGC